jgi:uncharacterized protein (TIGR00251 family)
MNIDVYVVTNSRKPYIAKIAESEFRIKVDAPAVGGKANSRIIELIAGHFGVPKSSVRIIKGDRSRRKTVQIPGPL